MFAATHTPFSADGSVNFSKIPDVVEMAIGQGVTGVFVNGTTGEGLSLTVEERQHTLEKFKESIQGRIKLYVHVGCASIEDAKALSIHAAALGVDAFAAIPPFYHKPATIDDLVDCIAEIAASAPSLPFYYYHIPGLTGVNFSMYSFLKKAKARIPNLKGLKYSSLDVAEFTRVVVEMGDSLDCMFGCDQAMLSALVIGCNRFVGSSYGPWGRLFTPIINAFNKGDLNEARRAQKLCTDAIIAMDSRGGVTTHKALIKRLHNIDIGEYRSPLKPSPAIAEAFQELEKMGFFNEMNAGK